MLFQDLFGTLLQEPGPVSKTQIPQQCLYFVICQPKEKKILNVCVHIGYYKVVI